MLQCHLVAKQSNNMSPHGIIIVYLSNFDKIHKYMLNRRLSTIHRVYTLTATDLTSVSICVRVVNIFAGLVTFDKVVPRSHDVTLSFSVDKPRSDSLSHTLPGRPVCLLFRMFMSRLITPSHTINPVHKSTKHLLLLRISSCSSARSSRSAHPSGRPSPCP